jgi:hypothetical protein
MKKKITSITLLLFLFNTILYSQNKLTKYYNTDFENISEKEFKDFLLKNNHQYNRFELEDQFAFILYQRKTKGKLSAEELEKLNISLLNKGSLNNNITIIIFYPGKDNCNNSNSISTWNVFDNDFLKKVEKKNLNNFWIYKSDEDLKYYHPKKVDWKNDDDQVIEKTFFKMHYPCFSSAVIDKEGNYILNLGEFGKQNILEDIDELTK